MAADESGPADDIRQRRPSSAVDVRRRSSLAILIAGGLLLAALFGLPWTHRALSVRVVGSPVGSFVLDQNAVHAPPERLGVAAAVVAGVLVALAAATLVAPPALRRLLARADVVAWFGGPLLLALLGLKVLKDTRYLGIGAWVSVVLAVAVAASALRFKPAPAEP